MSEVARVVALAGLAGVAAASLGACGRHRAAGTVDGGGFAVGDAGESAITFGASGDAPAPPRQGMVWIPAGSFNAGTPPDRVPRVAEEELPGVPVAMHGFYIDVYPFPNEPGAIATTNVTRDGAERACGGLGKRLCTELEWERACKGEGSLTYEYGDAYRAGPCNTGFPAEQSSRQPIGERLTCVSGFGVHDLHGGAWEWTSSPWGRGSRSPSLGVLRGGNAVAGELAGRCANALGRKESTHGATVGFRCCAGAPNEAQIDLPVATGKVLDRAVVPQRLAGVLAPLVPQITGAWFTAQGSDPKAFARAWTWRPVANEVLVIVGGCALGKKGDTCGAAVGTAADPETSASTGRAPRVLAEVDSGLEYPEIVQTGDARRLQVRGLEYRGTMVRELVYAYGLVEATPKRF